MNAQLIESDTVVVVIIPKESPAFRLPAKIEMAARLWKEGMPAEDIAEKELKMGSGDNAQSWICALRKALPELFPYRCHNQPRKDRS